MAVKAIQLIQIGTAMGSEEKAREAMRLASHKLPVKCKFAIKENAVKGGEA